MSFPYIPDSPQSMYDEPSYEIAPSVWAGSYSCLTNYFLHTRNIKLIINCCSTFSFIHELENSDLQISSDMVLISLDPSFSEDELNNDEVSFLNKTLIKYNRVLQNYLTHFKLLSSDSMAIVHKVSGNKELEMKSPILSGNLKNSLFAINRLIKLLRNINNSLEVLIISRDSNECSVQTALEISYLMDSYNFDYDSSFNHLQMRNPKIVPLNSSYYEDLLIIENLKKFFYENKEIKANSVVLTSNYKLKRRTDDDEDEDMEEHWTKRLK